MLSIADIGAISAFVHYNLGAGGGPSGLFLGYLATYNPHTQTLYRAGLFELPLLQSPGQRLDDLQAYGYYGARVGLNDLSLASPRWGAQAERAIGASRIDVVIDDGEYKGSAYGGKPVATGDTTAAQAPEYALFFRTPVGENAIVGGDLIAGTRRISVFGTSPFSDAYRRDGLFARLRVAKAELQGEQWFGADANADGFGTRVGSSGGYLRFKYYPTAHAYIGVRYDAFATPFVTRDVTWYGAFHITPHARFLLQDVHTIGGATALGAALTVGAPWPPKL